MTAKTFCRIFISSSSILFFSQQTIAQDSTAKHFDPSRPTNLYTRLSNNAEYNFLKNGNKSFGYRANFIWASRDQKNSAFFELPLLYATSSKKFGLSDTRFRYYCVPYKNYSKKPGAFGFAFDSYQPTGSYENGLGRGRWVIAPGVSTAFVFGKFSTFPILSYVYTSKIESEKVTNANNKGFSGYMLESICVYKFNSKSYMECTPFFLKNSYTNNGNNDFIVEGNYSYMVKPDKMQAGFFFRRIFNGNTTTLRAFWRVYF